MKKILVVGAGFSGAVLARQLVEELTDCEIDIIDSRDHIGGNCHTERDLKTGIMLHKYGPHIFHTSRNDVWQYVNKFAFFGNYTHRVKANTNKGIYSLPVNLLTINQLFQKKFTPKEAEAFLQKISASKIQEPKNFEEQALKFVGKDLYETFFYGYTKKQWGCEPRELSASILKRLPIRFDYNDNYFNDKYQGIPLDGYTNLISNIINHQRINITLNRQFNKVLDLGNYYHIFYAGPIDSYYNFSEGKLSYRTITFDRIDTIGDYQGNAQMNFTSMNEEFTRICEHKHFAPWETFENSVSFKEYSKETGDTDTPFYPKHLEKDRELILKYKKVAISDFNISFIGRLGTYRYLDMHQVIGESLDFSKIVIECLRSKSPIPAFFN
jgi:UDP-galactopyranose mutase